MTPEELSELIDEHFGTDNLDDGEEDADEPDDEKENPRVCVNHRHKLGDLNGDDAE